MVGLSNTVDYYEFNAKIKFANAGNTGGGAKIERGLEYFI